MNKCCLCEREAVEGKTACQPHMEVTRLAFRLWLRDKPITEESVWVAAESRGQEIGFTREELPGLLDGLEIGTEGDDEEQ